MARKIAKKSAPQKASTKVKAKIVKKAVPVKKVQPAKKSAAKLAKPILKAPKKSVKKAVKPLQTPKPTAPKLAKPSSKILAVGSAVPHFEMPATMVGNVSLGSLKGKPFVLYFYPKDDTSGCTAQACEFRNTLPNFAKLGATIIGVSKDSMESHEKFSRKYNLTFPLASDESTQVCEAFGTWVQKSMYGRTYMGIERSTFLVDSQGIIRAVWRKVSVPGHIEDVRKALEVL